MVLYVCPFVSPSQNVPFTSSNYQNIPIPGADMPAVPSIADVVAVVLQLCGPLYAELSIVDVMSHIYDTPMIGATDNEATH